MPIKLWCTVATPSSAIFLNEKSKQLLNCTEKVMFFYDRICAGAYSNWNSFHSLM